MKRVILYIRVSTAGQEDGYSIEGQKERLIAYCKARDWVIVKIYTDPGYSGSSLERPGIQNVIEDARNKAADAVLVYKLDRLSRSQKDTMYLIEDVFLPNGLDFVSMQESFDTTSSYGLAMVGILSVFAQLERSGIRDRTFSGRVDRAKEGLWHGGGTDPIGYDYIDGELVVNKAEAEQIQRIYKMYAAGHTITYIQEEMAGFRTKHGDWRHPGTVAAVLDNDLYAGTVHFSGVERPESHDAIIPAPLNKKVKERRSVALGRNYKAKDSEYLLTGFLRCANCGARYFAKKARNGTISYCCHSRAKVNKKMVKDMNCKNKNWPLHELEAAVKNELLKLSESENFLSDLAKHKGINTEEGINSPSAQVQEEIEDIDRQIKKYMDLYAFDNMPVEEIASSIEDLYKKKQELIPKVDDQPIRDFQVEEIRVTLNSFADMWIDGDKKSRRLFLELLKVGQILVTEDGVILEFL